MKRYKIGEVAKLLGLTTQALRFYEQEGIIVPKKSENGTRYFTEPDIVRLMAFKRFRLIDFTVQDVAVHFKNGNTVNLIEKMRMQREQLVRQSQALLRRAQAIEKFEKMLRIAKSRENTMTCMERPDIYMHPCTLAELDRMDDAQREKFEEFMAAMPDAHICFAYTPGEKTVPKFHFAITERDAGEWGLSPENTLHFAGRKCVQLIVRTDEKLWEAEYLEEQVARVEAAGYTVDRDAPVLGQQLVSESEGKKGYLLAALYIPIK